MNRRQALQLAALTGLSPALGARPRDGGRGGGSSPRLQPFVQPLPYPPPPIPVAPFKPSAVATRHLQALGAAAALANYTTLIQEEADVSLHPDLPLTRVWRYRDINAPESSPYLCGPTYIARSGIPQVVRHLNRLPSNHVGFGVPYTTTHYHGGHIMPIFDGFPESVSDLEMPTVIGPGEQFDYLYGMQAPGFDRGTPDVTECPSTQWYHDHMLDFTGPNVYRGLAAFYLVFDDLDTGDENTGLRLPSGPFDVPMVLQDRRIGRDGQLIYLPEDFNGFLGDQMVVNGAIQPYLNVQRRKYRFRFLNGANARFFLMRLTDDENRHPVSFDVIGTDGGLMARPMRGQSSMFIGPAERVEIVVDFSRFPSGTRLYLTDFIRQDSGRGPGGDYEHPDEVSVDDGKRLVEFRVTGGSVPDPSRVPDELRMFQPIPQEKLDAAERRHFEFERTGGAWAINGEFVDLTRPLARIRMDRPQIWTFKNGGGGWWHPVHTHIEMGRVLRRNGRTAGLMESDGSAKKDDIILSGGDEVEVYFDFRDYTGMSVFHCHNLEHEDHFMMGRFDIIP
jgi:FtsP/CotA-like multicopper oxidase with cupredoxin domain